MIPAFKRTVAIIRLGLSVYVIIAASFNAAAAMDFSTKQLSDGDRFILAKGEIVDGDTERLRIALQSVGRNRYGNKEMALESGGGLVAESLKMVALMDKEKVSTIVLPGAMCASPRLGQCRARRADPKERSPARSRRGRAALAWCLIGARNAATG
jgi:hypothetical protein